MKQRFLFLASILLYFGTSGGSLATPTPKKEVIEPEIISGEICEWEEFKPSCPQGHVVYVRSARYGRMKENRCITGGVGGMGCEANVTQKVAGICTGRGSCVLRVIDLFGFGECHKDYKSYLEVHYTCIRVVTSSTGCPWESSSTSSSSPSSSLSSSSHHQIWGMMFTTPNVMSFGDRAADFDSTSKIVGGHYIESSTSGILSSSVAIETGDGTRRCPWMFKLHPPQTLNLTFHQFTDHNFASTVEVTESYKGSSGGRYHGNDGGRGRQTSHQIHVTSGLPSTYVSGKDTVEVVLIFLNSTNYVTNLSDNYDVGSDHHHHHHQLSPPPPPLHRHARRDDRSERHRLQVVMETAAVLIEFRVNGCTPLNHPPNTWSSTDGHVTNVTCNDTGEYFRLTCAGNEWSGRLGNCSEVLSRRRLDGMEFWNEPMQHGILLVVLLGIMIGIAIGFSMLMAVLAYIKKSRQQRRIRGHLANNCRDVTADLSLFDLYDPSDPLTHDLSQSYSHHHHHHHHRHQQHHHHHRELKFSEEEEEDTDEEAKTRIYGGSLLEGNVVSMATPVDEINRRNWIWSTWVKRSEVNYGVNCGREGDWDISKTGCEKAASTMTMMMRRMTGRTRKDRADVFSRCPPRRHDNEEMETTDTTVDASDHVTIGTDELASSQLEVDKTGEEINVDTPTNLSAFGGKEFSNNKQQQQLCASNEPSHPLFASLFNSSDDRQVNLDPRSPPQPQNSSLSKSCKASSHMQSAANCNVTNVLHQQHTNNSSCVKPQVVGTPSRNKDGLYGVCFTSDAPYNSLVLNARRQQQQQRQQLQQNFLQYPPYSVLSHNPCCQHHDVLTHRHGNRHDNDIVVGDDDDDDTYDVERGTDDEDNKTDLSPGNLHHHHHHLQNISSAGIHHRRHHHNQDRHQLNQGLNHYHHRLYNHNHHHHHNFVKPDLVTQTPPPLPVKCIKTNHRCPLCSVNNLSVTSSSSAIL